MEEILFTFKQQRLRLYKTVLQIIIIIALLFALCYFFTFEILFLILPAIIVIWAGYNIIRADKLFERERNEIDLELQRNALFFMRFMKRNCFSCEEQISPLEFQKYCLKDGCSLSEILKQWGNASSNLLCLNCYEQLKNKRKNRDD